jgi:hypothetical protein
MEEYGWDDKWDNPAYVAAVEANIKANARKGRNKRWIASNPDAQEVNDFLEDVSNNLGMKRPGQFITDMAESLEEWGHLTPKQTDAVIKSIKREQGWKDDREKAEQELLEKGVQVPVTDERILVEGKVISVKEERDNFSYQERYILKILVVTDEGWKVWGTAPSVISSVEKGDRVQFMARVQQSDRDQLFGFFKRPTKAKVVEPEMA